MSERTPPASASPAGPRPGAGAGWLARLVWWAAGAAFRREIEGAAVSLAKVLERETAARSELERAVERRLAELGAAADDLRQAYLATRGEFEEVRDRRLPQVAAAVATASSAVGAVQREIEGLRDVRVPAAEDGLGALQQTGSSLQREVEALRDLRLPHVESDLARMQQAIDSAHAAVAGLQALAEELRDRRLPALAAHTDAVVGQLHEEIAETAGLTERLARGEPLRVTVAPAVEARIPAAVAAASRAFADAFRGDRREIIGRAADHTALLRAAAPVLDVGCGRGELLEALRDAGVEARGVDADPAMVAACRRLALVADEGDAVAALRLVPPAALGGVAAVHVIEHLPAAGWMALVEAAAAALRPGGTLLIESPNPESLRVGGGLFWLDPTHVAPVHPEALAFVAKALGLEVVETRLLHPFPPEQTLTREDQPQPVRELARRLDGWLSAPRDYLLVARKP